MSKKRKKKKKKAVPARPEPPRNVSLLERIKSAEIFTYHPLGMNDYITAALLFLINFGVYLKTLCPTVYILDSGEFILGAAGLGVLHPPGYPIYSLTGSVFTHLPLSSVSFRINLASTVFAGLAVVFLYFTLKKLTGSRIISAGCSLFTAFTSVYWTQSITAEVYSLNVFFMTSVLFLLLCWDNRRSARFLYAASFVYGLSLTNHYISFLFLPAFLLFLLLRNPRFFIKRGLLLKSLLFFLAGLTMYLYLPVRSKTNPAVDWGDPETFSSFIFHVKRMQYRLLEFGKEVGSAEKVKLTRSFLNTLIPQYGYILTSAAIMGILASFVAAPALAVTAALIFILNSIGLIVILQSPYNPKVVYLQSVYFIPAYFIFSLWAGMGIKAMKPLWNKMGKYAPPALLALLIALNCRLLIKNYHSCDLSKNFFAYDYAVNQLQKIKPGSILLMGSEESQIFTMAYMHAIEKRGDHVVFCDERGVFFQDNYRSLLELAGTETWTTGTERGIVLNSTAPVFNNTTNDPADLPSHRLVNHGLLYRWMENNAAIPQNDHIQKLFRTRGYKDPAIPKDLIIRFVMSNFYYHEAENFMEKEQWKKAEQSLFKASRLGYGLSAVHHNIAGRFAEMHEYPAAERESEFVKKVALKATENPLSIINV